MTRCLTGGRGLSWYPGRGRSHHKGVGHRAYFSFVLLITEATVVMACFNKSESCVSWGSQESYLQSEAHVNILSLGPRGPKELGCSPYAQERGQLPSLALGHLRSPIPDSSLDPSLSSVAVPSTHVEKCPGPWGPPLCHGPQEAQ